MILVMHVKNMIIVMILVARRSLNVIKISKKICSKNVLN